MKELSGTGLLPSTAPEVEALLASFKVRLNYSFNNKF
jgi:hypothetical protein